jgi:hypothetical protein
VPERPAHFHPPSRCNLCGADLEWVLRSVPQGKPTHPRGVDEGTVMEQLVPTIPGTGLPHSLNCRGPRLVAAA